MSDLTSWIQQYIHGDTLNAWAAAAIIVLVTALVAAFATRLIRRLMRADGLPIPESSILVNIVRVVIWTLGISLMLSTCFGVDVNALLAALGVGGIALSLGLQDTIRNFIGGVQVTVLGIVRPGDHVVIGNVDGIVQDVSWRQTVVEDYEKTIHLIPNAVINSTAVQKVEPEHLVVTPISFVNDGQDIDELVREMEQLAKRAVEKVAKLEKDPWILLTQIGEYGIWGKMRFVLEDVENAREARDAALRAIAPYTRSNAPDVLLDNGDED